MRLRRLLSGLFRSVFLFFSVLAGVQGFFQGGKPFSVAQSHHQESRHHFQQGKEDEEAGSVECGYFLLAEEGEEGAAGQEGQVSVHGCQKDQEEGGNAPEKDIDEQGVVFQPFPGRFQHKGRHDDGIPPEDGQADHEQNGLDSVSRPCGMFHEMEEIAGNADEKSCQDGEEEASGHPRQEEQALEPSRLLFIRLLHMDGEQGGRSR